MTHIIILLVLTIICDLITWGALTLLEYSPPNTHNKENDVANDNKGWREGGSLVVFFDKFIPLPFPVNVCFFLDSSKCEAEN